MSQINSSWNHTKEQIRSLPISTIIGKFIPLTKKGQNYEGICPFHRDTHPSLKVNDQKNLFKCFVCAQAGDALTFVMNFKKIDFPAAMQLLANELGLEIPQQQNPKREAMSPHAKLYRCMDLALKFYLEQTQHQQPLEFLQFLEHRQINQETATHFQLCFASGKSSLADYLKTLDAEPAWQGIYQCGLDLGLFKLGDYGHYDTFRHRILFPIFNISHQVVGFGSRSIHEDQKPKYLNSQDSPIFNKRSILYGLNFAKNFIREKSQGILVEGYMDTITLFQHGFKNTVAVMGVALTEQQCRSITSLTKNWLFILDQDAAGQNAVQRSLPLFLSAKCIPLRVDLAPFKDPDEFIRAEGAILFQQKILQSQNWIDYSMDIIVSESNQAHENIDKKLALLDRIFLLLSPLKEEISALDRIAQAAHRMQIQSPKELIWQRYRDYLHHHQQNTHSPAYLTKELSNPFKPIEFTKSKELASTQEHQVPQSTSILIEKNIPLTTELFPSIHSIEWSILKYLVLNPKLLKLKNFTEILLFVNNRKVKEILDYLPRVYQEVDQGDYPQTVITLLEKNNAPADWINELNSLFFSWENYSQELGHQEKQLEDFKRKLKIEKLKKSKEQLRASLKEAQSNNEIELILTEIHGIDKKIFELKHKAIAHLKSDLSQIEKMDE